MINPDRAHNKASTHVEIGEQRDRDAPSMSAPSESTEPLSFTVIPATDSPLPTSFINLLSVLLRQPSVVGAEDAFFRVLERELEERGADVYWYEGVLVTQGS